MKPSKTGYKSTSKDKNNPYNLINSNRITMKGVDFPVMGISDTGDKRVMMPNEEHLFKGNKVIEIPMRHYQTGGDTGLSPERAAEILQQGHVYGAELTSAQRAHFASIAGTDEEGNPLDDNQDGNQDDSQVDSSQDDSGMSDEDFMKYGGIHINPSKKGTFTAAATKHGKSVQEFASQVLANKGAYSEAMIKKANFARNASHFKHQEGGMVDGDYLYAQDGTEVPPQFRNIGHYNNYYSNNKNYAVSPYSTNAAGKEYYDKTKFSYTPGAGKGDEGTWKGLTPEAQASLNTGSGGNKPQQSAFTSYQAPVKQFTQAAPKPQILWKSTGQGTYVHSGTGATGQYDSSGIMRTISQGGQQAPAPAGPTPSGQTLPPPAATVSPAPTTRQYGGSTMKGDVERFIKNYNKKMGGSTAQQGSTTDSIVDNKKATFTQYLQQNAMNHMLREELPDLMHHMAYGGMYQTGGSNGFQGQAQQDAMNSGSPYAPGAFENNEAGPDYQNGMTTDPSQAMGNLGQPLDTSGTKQAYKDSHEAMNFQRQQNDISHPHDNSPTWMQKHGQQVAMGTIAGLNVAAGMFGANDAKNAQKRLNSKTSADNVFQTNHGANRGDYETNSGAFRPNQNTPVQFAGKNSAQPYKAGGDVSSRLEAKPSYKAGDTHELTEQEISHLVSRGYKLQYL